MPKVETPGHPRHSPPLSDAVVNYFTNTYEIPIFFAACETSPGISLLVIVK